jgi:hypothetical protein
MGKVALHSNAWEGKQSRSTPLGPFSWLQHTFADYLHTTPMKGNKGELGSLPQAQLAGREGEGDVRSHSLAGCEPGTRLF